MLTNSPAADLPQPAIPWQGLFALARHWAGSGSLFDWLGPSEWEIAREWTADVTRARTAAALLLYLETSVLPRLPRRASEWLDLLEQQVYRASEFTDVPTPHTDWAATLSEFGRYPSILYVERRPRGTFDTPLTRTLKWFCMGIIRAEALVERTLGHRPLQERTRTRLRFALDLPEVQGAADVADPGDFDVSVCVDMGGVWALIGRNARRLAALWRGSVLNQILALAPILPKLGSQLFELGTLGVAATTVRQAAPIARWRTRTPLAAARPGRPCLQADLQEGTWDCYYQTVPEAYRASDSPYRTLTKPLGGGSLRPDLWMIFDGTTPPSELVVECKYSFDPSYIAGGVMQILAYWQEYSPPHEVQRVYIVVCPETVVVTPRTWGGRLVLGTPAHFHELVAAVLRGGGAQLLASWA